MISYAHKELVRYWPVVSAKLLAQYCDGSHTYKNSDGTLSWWQNDLRHRSGDLPAYINTRSYGRLIWYQNGRCHRDGDKPSWIDAGGGLAWYQNGNQHKLCGPARISADGRLSWWINDKNITREVTEWLNGEEWHGTPEQIVEFKFRFT